MEHKFFLFSYPTFYSYTEGYLISRIRKYGKAFEEANKYTLRLPVDIATHEFVSEETVKKFFGKGTKVVKTPTTSHYLVFDNPLTETEKTFWMGFKLGFYSAPRR